jgi:hypothetical protein
MMRLTSIRKQVRCTGQRLTLYVKDLMRLGLDQQEIQQPVMLFNAAVLLEIKG